MNNEIVSAFNHCFIHMLIKQWLKAETILLVILVTTTMAIHAIFWILFASIFLLVYDMKSVGTFFNDLSKQIRK